jgi:DNA/RNA-binding domain of Phe-tRNA-synthetase-like protein
MGGFEYAPDLIERFPATTGGVIHARAVVNGVTPPELVSEYREEHERVKAWLGDTPLSEIPEIAAWRRTFREFGVDPTKYRSAIEALLRRLGKQGDIPSINAMVDMANLVSIRHRLPVAVFDQGPVSGVTTVRFAHGDEAFTDLGSEEVSNPEPGEVIFVDEEGLVSARRWCWRQSAQSAAGPGTNEVVITVEGQHETAPAQVAVAVDELLGLLARHQPDAVSTSVMLHFDSPSFVF